MGNQFSMCEIGQAGVRVSEPMNADRANLELKRVGGSSMKPPVHGYNYQVINMVGNLVSPTVVTFPEVSINAASLFKFAPNSILTGISLTSSINNPNGVTAGVFVGYGDRTVYSIQQANNFFINHITISTQISSRATGFSFGETSGFEVESGQRWGVWLVGDGDTEISFVATLYYIKQGR